MQVLKDLPFEVHVSDGQEEQALSIARRVDRAEGWLGSNLGFHPTFALYVADESDWSSVAEFPAYGMPHTADRERLVVGTTPAPFFTHAAVTYLPYTSDGTRARLHAAYGDPLDLGSFVDLIAVHELGHLYHEQVPFYFPAFWLNEFFANIAMVGYVMENEPDLVESVKAFATAAVETPATEMTEHELGRMEASLHAGPDNYVWYQMVLIAGVVDLWTAAGPDAMVAVYESFRQPMGQEHVLAELNRIHPTAGAIVTDWPG